MSSQEEGPIQYDWWQEEGGRDVKDACTQKRT